MISLEKIYRIIDANLNRATEGLRVIEDVVRFILNNAHLWGEIRRTRHSLVKIMKEEASFDFHKLITCRDSYNDVGADFKEEGREGIENIIRANFRRVEEAERSLEEFSKLITPSLSEKFKKIRFQTYSLEKRVEEKLYNALHNKQKS
ncbi:thiamine-phosphate pyrophosphorylase [Candidatus Aerophobetes bacterium]|nr:thiamine-phosphate pyrophosphorylase [Candidatus Aerophobetes bacterium]